MTAITLLIDPNDGCNLNCRHCGKQCPHLKPVHRQQVMGPDRYAAVLEALQPHLASIALGCIREPLVHPAIAALIQLSDRQAHLEGLTLSTNGTCLEPALIALFAKGRHRWQI